MAVVRLLLKARQAIEQQTDDLDRKVLKLARYDACRREVREADVTVVPGTECLERGLRRESDRRHPAQGIDRKRDGTA
jgi:hypothetical protein